MKYLKYALITLVVLGIGAGVYFSGLLGSGDDHDEEVVLDEHGNPIPVVEGGFKKPGIYMPMQPPFVVNFTHRGTLHYLQLEMDMLYHDQDIIDTIQMNMPAVRNELILLFSNQEFEKLITAEGKEELRKEIVLAVNEIAGVEPDPETGEADGEVYLTHFVMQ